MSKYYEEHEEAVYAARATVRKAREALGVTKMAYLKAKEYMVIAKRHEDRRQTDE